MLYFKILQDLSTWPLFGSMFRSMLPLFGDIIYLEPVFREEVKTDFASHTGNIFLFELKSKDPAVVFSMKIYIVTTAPTTADFGAMAGGDWLYDKTPGTPVLYFKDAAASGDNFATVTTTT